MSNSSDTEAEKYSDGYNDTMMVITPDWLKSIKDSRGLTKGQAYLLDRQTGGAPYAGKEISNRVANFLVHCRGYRNGRYSCESI